MRHLHRNTSLNLVDELVRQDTQHSRHLKVGRACNKLLKQK